MLSDVADTNEGCVSVMIWLFSKQSLQKQDSWADCNEKQFQENNWKSLTYSYVCILICYQMTHIYLDIVSFTVLPSNMSYCEHL